MSGYRPPGFVSGAIAFLLVMVGLLVLVSLLARLPFVLWRPGKGRFAKGFSAGALVLLLCGTALFLGADLTDRHPSFRRLLDDAAPWLAGLVLLLAIAAGVRAGRRRAVATSAAAAPAETAGGVPPDADHAEPPPSG